MSTYENAPATALLATDCAACGRPLLDAMSVELGIGPECRRKAGWTKRKGFVAGQAADWARAELLLRQGGLFELAVQGNEQTTCNRLVHRLACGDLDMDHTVLAIAAIAALGYRRLAEACTPALRKVSVETEGNVLVVKTGTYSEAFTCACRNVPGARWDRARKARLVPTTSKIALWQAIREGFGHLALVYAERVGLT
jgi:hypothetical protein